MGAWGHEPFDNDDAADFLANLAEGEEVDFAELFEGLKDNADAPEASNAIAAAAIVAAARSGKLPELPEDLEDWFKASKAQLKALSPLALVAVKKVRAASELKDLWAESDDHAKWDATLAELERQLG